MTIVVIPNVSFCPVHTSYPFGFSSLIIITVYVHAISFSPLNEHTTYPTFVSSLIST